jgi:DNA-binding Lrp family transcriptional regulator
LPASLAFSDESRYRILRLIEQNSAISQREIARELGISLGKVNFCLQALIDKGILKVNILLEVLGRTTRVRVPLDVLIPLPTT